MAAYTVRSSSCHPQYRDPDNFGFTRDLKPQLRFKMGNFVILATSLVLAVAGYCTTEADFLNYTNNIKRFCKESCPPKETPRGFNHCKAYCSGRWIEFYSLELEWAFMILSSISLLIMIIGICTLYLEGRIPLLKLLGKIVIILTVAGGSCMLLGVVIHDAYEEYTLFLALRDKSRVPGIMVDIRWEGKYRAKIAAGSLCIIAAFLEIVAAFCYRKRSGFTGYFPSAGTIHPENPNIIIVKQQEAEQETKF